jgi:hypothetical protein
MIKLKFFAWVFTIICTIWFFVRIDDLSSYESSFGSPAFSLPFILGTFLSSELIPIILWLIYFIPQMQDFHIRNKYKKLLISDIPEINNFYKDLKYIENKIEKLRQTYKIIKDSFDQSLIDDPKYQFESMKLKESIDNLVEEKNKLINQKKNIEKCLPELYNLLALKQKEIITEIEFTDKKNELIKKSK